MNNEILEKFNIRPKILLVDDNGNNLELLEALLSELETDFVLVESGFEAIKKVNSEEFALILLDIQMPDIDGYEVLEKIRENPQNHLLPVIFISAIYSDIEYKIKGIKTGAIDFISKPIISDILIGKVQQFLELYLNKKQLELYQNHLKLLVEQRTAELKVAKEKAEESERLKTAFLTNMSHEIRTPMNAIIGFSTILAEELQSDEQREYVEIISQNAMNLLQIIDSVLEIAQIETGELVLVKKSFSLNNLFFELFQHFEEIKNRNLQINIELRISKIKYKEPISLYSSYSILKEVMETLLYNALKFTDKGYIEFGYVIEDAKIRFYVEDTGVGIPKESLHLVFHRFTKIFPDKNRLFSGIGLGLAIAKRFVELMGGEMSVRSSFGKGSTFYFTLPFEV